MNASNSQISGAHRTMIYHELLHAMVVLIVVFCATGVTILKPNVISSDLLSFVYGGALSYAGARAASARQALTRGADDHAAR